jgi:hypothetical protein
VVSPEHPDTNHVRHNLAALLLASCSASQALALGEAALAAQDKAFGRGYHWTKEAARVTTDALDALGRSDQAKAPRASYDTRGTAE